MEEIIAPYHGPTMYSTWNVRQQIFPQVRIFTNTQIYKLCKVFVQSKYIRLNKLLPVKMFQWIPVWKQLLAQLLLWGQKDQGVEVLPSVLSPLSLGISYHQYYMIQVLCHLGVFYL